ncbi:MPV17.2 family protein [Megaselia abdita]
MIRLVGRNILNLSRTTKNNYVKALDKHPYIMEAIQVSTLMGAGDLLTQTIIDKRRTFKEINWIRTAQFTGMGFFFVGPLLRYWFIKLDKIVSKNQSVLKRTTKKVFLDQIIVDPPFLAVFTVILSAVQGMNTAQIKDRLSNDFIDVLKTNLMIWPAAQFINFALIPLRYQVIFVEFIAIFWNAYLSNVLNAENIVDIKIKSDILSTNESEKKNIS